MASPNCVNERLPHFLVGKNRRSPSPRFWRSPRASSVLDEPTAALDPISSRAVFDVLREAQRLTGVTVVVIEQMVALLAEYCDRIIVLDNGSVALDGTPHDVFGHSDELRAIGVDSPRTARISNSLASLGLVEVERPALTVDEAQALVMQALDGRTAPTSDMAHSIVRASRRSEGGCVRITRNGPHRRARGRQLFLWRGLRLRRRHRPHGAPR